MDSIRFCRVRLNDLDVTVFFQERKQESDVGAVYHDHMYAEMLFCTQGGLNVYTEEGEFTIGEREMVLIPRTVIHYTVTASPGAVVKVYGLVAERCACEDAADVFGQMAPLFTDSIVRVFSEADSFLPLLEKCEERPDDPGACFLIVRFLEGLQKARRVERTVPLPAEKGPLPERELARFVRLRELINREYCGDLTLHRVASELYLSEQYAARIIRKYYGTSLMKIVFAKRMDAAATLLRTTDETAEAIGQKVGFRAKSGFYRTFRDHFGMTPAQYRRSVRVLSAEREKKGRAAGRTNAS